ncbi:MAG: hypothetical protein ACR2RV_04175, partial [Verrucomicrobiales bacterium]
MGLSSNVVVGEEEKAGAAGDIEKCPVMGTPASPYRHTAASAMSNRDWWPNQLNLGILHQNSAKANPMGED